MYTHRLSELRHEWINNVYWNYWCQRLLTKVFWTILHQQKNVKHIVNRKTTKTNILGKNYCTYIVLYFVNIILSWDKIIVCTLITFYFSHLLLSFLLVYTFVLILASTAKAIDKHRPINIVSQPGIGPGTLWFQANYETPDATMTSMERSKVGTKEK